MPSSKTKRVLSFLNIKRIENGFLVAEVFDNEDTPNREHYCDSVDSLIAFVDKTFTKKGK